jgi:hypothetical protein
MHFRVCQTIRAIGNTDYLAMPDHGMSKFIGRLLFLVRTRSDRIETIIVILLTMYLHPILMNIGPSHDNRLMSGLMDLTCISTGDIAGRTGRDPFILQGPSGHSGRNIGMKLDIPLFGKGDRRAPTMERSCHANASARRSTTHHCMHRHVDTYGCSPSGFTMPLRLINCIAMCDARRPELRAGEWSRECRHSRFLTFWLLVSGFCLLKLGILPQ